MIAAEFYKIALLTRKLNLSYIHASPTEATLKIGTKCINGKNVQVLRIYSDSDKKHKKEFRLDSSNADEWKDLLIEQQRRANIETNLKFRSELENRSLKLDLLRKVEQRFSKAAFDRLIERNDPSIKKGHMYDGHCFRSKSEVMIAQIINDLGLEYKYEVEIAIGSKTYYADFAVYCHETGRFFFIEHFGLMGDDEYRTHTFQKITVYSRSGLIEGLDILYTFENSDGSFYTDVYKGKILSVIISQVITMTNQ
ncbi:MAG: hypothetical protein IKX68_02955 [Clostridiales bacterium]|nr:hypothetical protein [Clostridiales bacterium]